MPIPGMAVARSVRSNGIAFIHRVADSALGSARGADGAIAAAHAIEPKLLPVASAQVNDLHAFLQRPIVWANDMNCFAKASVSARHVNEVLGRGLTPVDDAFHAAIAILPAPPTANGWSFHAGVVVQDAKRGPVVIDHLTDAAQSSPMPLAEWGRTYGVALDDIRVVSPWAGTAGVKGDLTDAGTWKWIREALPETWGNARKYGVQVERTG